MIAVGSPEIARLVCAQSLPWLENFVLFSFSSSSANGALYTALFSWFSRRPDVRASLLEIGKHRYVDSVRRLSPVLHDAIRIGVIAD
jgi:hypothetical protein